MGETDDLWREVVDQASGMGIETLEPNPYSPDGTDQAIDHALDRMEEALRDWEQNGLPEGDTPVPRDQEPPDDHRHDQDEGGPLDDEPPEHDPDEAPDDGEPDDDQPRDDEDKDPWEVSGRSSEGGSEGGPGGDDFIEPPSLEDDIWAVSPPEDKPKPSEGDDQRPDRSPPEPDGSGNGRGGNQPDEPDAPDDGDAGQEPDGDQGRGDAGGPEPDGEGGRPDGGDRGPDNPDQDEPDRSHREPEPPRRDAEPSGPRERLQRIQQRFDDLIRRERGGGRSRGDRPGGDKGASGRGRGAGGTGKKSDTKPSDSDHAAKKERPDITGSGGGKEKPPDRCDAESHGQQGGDTPPPKEPTESKPGAGGSGRG